VEGGAVVEHRLVGHVDSAHCIYSLPLSLSVLSSQSIEGKGLGKREGEGGYGERFRCKVVPERDTIVPGRRFWRETIESILEREAR
jgi:hypothetical protein